MESYDPPNDEEGILQKDYAAKRESTVLLARLQLLPTLRILLKNPEF
jgi:hypothetical protein